MRKTSFVAILTCCGSLLCLPALGQNASPVLPTDPKELMLLAAQTNGLTGDDMKPWRLKATWKLLDESGNVTDQGTYEEFWVSRTKYKVIFTNSTASRTEYGTDKGILNSDTEKPLDTHDLRRQMLSPMPSANSLENYDFILRHVAAGNVNLNCLNRKDAMGNPSGTTYCLGTLQPALRIREDAGIYSVPESSEKTLRNGIISYQGHYVGGDLKIFYGSKRSLSAHLDTIEPLNTIDDAVFTPPANAVPQKVDKRISIAGGVAQGLILKKVAPEYPPIAKAAHVSGTVVLQATITKEGKIANLKVISGPATLQQASLDAVKDWLYRPYLLEGEPVEVQTTVNVVFTLGASMPDLPSPPSTGPQFPH